MNESMDSLSALQDIKSLMELLIDNLAGVVQYDGRLQTSIADVCDIMEDANGGRAIGNFD